ncbi:hypothetical protein DFH09DRAFT_1367915 [Mycena vulgaris]|nr:hypothetical protein DFH09DRAFT_1367915 [Mycena vulgaris]
MRLRYGLFLCSAFPSFSLAFPLNPPITELPFPPLTLPPQRFDFSSFDLTSSLPPAEITLAEPVSLPDSCAQYVGPAQECTSDMTALNVYFEDCGSPFTVCRCADAEMSMDTVLDRFGRVPVGLRRYAGPIVVLSDTAGPHAYTLTSGDSHFFGDCAVDAWVHEMMHAFDFAGATMQSNSSGWAEALAADSCVPDQYSLTNQVEDFAQVGVLKTYMLLHGSLPPKFTAECMANQLAFMDALELYDPGTLFGNNCDIIDNGPSARHTTAPAILDPSRTFHPVPPDDNAFTASADPNAAATARAKSAAPPSLRPPRTFSEIAGPTLTLRPQATGYDFDLEAALPAASNTLSQLPGLPTNCAQFLGPGKECTTNMAAMAVTYEDCGDPFTVCRCDNANMTMDTAVDRLGRVPVGLRRFIGTVLVMENVTEAYTNLSTGDIHLSGDCNMDVWVHEATHAFDFRTGYSNSAPSSSHVWVKAIADDSCAPDQYSLRNEMEDFAQLSVIKIYALLHDGHLPPGFSADCMSHQLDFMSMLNVYNTTNLFGNTCNIQDGAVGVRHNKTPAVLDATRVFKTVPLDQPTSTSIPLGTTAPHSNSAGASLSQMSPPPWIPDMILALLIVASIWSLKT